MSTAFLEFHNFNPPAVGDTLTPVQYGYQSTEFTGTLVEATGVVQPAVLGDGYIGFYGGYYPTTDNVEEDVVFGSPQQVGTLSSSDSGDEGNIDHTGIIPCDTLDLVVGTYNICLGAVDFTTGEVVYFDLGSTTGGVTISQNNTFVEVENDQTCHLQAKYRQNERWRVSTTLQSVTSDKLRMIFASSDKAFRDPTTTPTLTIGGQEICSFPEEWELLICGPGPGCGCRTFHFPRVMVMSESIDYTITKESPVQLALEWEVLASCPDGTLLYISEQCDTLISGPFSCVQDPLPPCPPEPPRASPLNIGQIPDGMSANGDLNTVTFPGSDPNLTFSIDTSNPHADRITLNPDGTFVINTD